MKRLLAPFALVLVLAASVPVRASSVPFIQGAVSGIEFCPQFACGAAIFSGVFVGQVGTGRFAAGIMTVAVTHEDLPEPGYTAAITGGLWRLRLLNGRLISGQVTGGSLLANDDNTFGVAVSLQLLSGGSGTLSFTGLLDHNTVIPTIAGSLTQ